MYTNSTALQDADNAFQANNQRTIKTNSNKLHTAQEREFIMGVPSTIGKNGMCVTLGGKHDGYCPISDIGDAKVGERALFKVMSSNNEDAMPNFIQEQGSTLESITSLAQSAEPTLVKVLKVARGKNGNSVTGLSVMFEDGAAKGTVGHMPAWELARNTDLNNLVGQVIAAAVTEVSPHKGGKNGLVLLSHTKAFGENTKAAVSCVKIGETIEAKVLKFINAAKNRRTPQCASHIYEKR